MSTKTIIAWVNGAAQEVNVPDVDYTSPSIISAQISAIITTVTLPVADWAVYNISTYSQELSSSFFTVNSMVDLQPTPEQLAVWQDDGLAFNTVNDNGAVTVYCAGGKPSEDITVQIKIQEVAIV